MKTKTTTLLTLLVAASWLMPPAAAEEADDNTRGGDSRTVTVCRYEESPLTTLGHGCAHATVAYAIVKCTRNTETRLRTCDVLFTLDLTVEGWAACGSASSQWVPRSALTCTVAPLPFLGQSTTHEEGLHRFTGIPDDGATFTAEGEVCVDYRSYPTKCEDLDIDVIFSPFANVNNGLGPLVAYVFDVLAATLSAPPPVGVEDLPGMQ